MEWLWIILVAGATFGVCWLVDKGFTKLFRSKAQHHSGLAVRLNKHYAGFGLVLFVVGLGDVFTGISQSTALAVGGGVLMITGVCLIVYYMTFGVFYDDAGFVLTTFGKKSRTYRYSDIESQQLYNNAGTILIELYLSDGRAMQLPATLSGTYLFLDKAFEGWLAQKGLRKEECPFHDPDNSWWFPKAEG